MYSISRRATQNGAKPAVDLVNPEHNQDPQQVEVSQQYQDGVSSPFRVVDFILGAGETATIFFILGAAPAMVPILLTFVCTSLVTGGVRRIVHIHWPSDGDTRRLEPPIQWGRTPGTKDHRPRKKRTKNP